MPLELASLFRSRRSSWLGCPSAALLPKAWLVVLPSGSVTSKLLPGQLCRPFGCFCHTNVRGMQVAEQVKASRAPHLQYSKTSLICTKASSGPSRRTPDSSVKLTASVMNHGTYPQIAGDKTADPHDI